ncbi:MAG: aminoacyl--tRNA ligase-related protein [Candidatus Woesearchaeota archaeon]|jgi:seryl-tRNA synthetase
MVNLKEGDVIRQGKHQNSKNDSNLDIASFFGDFIIGTGHYVLLPKATTLLRRLDNILETILAQNIGFEEVILPKMAPVETFQKAGILGRWDSYLLSVTPYSTTQGISEQYILDPLQCTAFYQYHAGKSIDVSEKPLLWYDHSGPTYRNENVPRLRAGIRQREFHRAEFMYLGSPEQVTATRKKCLSALENLCDDLKLQYRIVVGAGCYECNPEENSSNDIIPILDLEIFCPTESKNQWLEVAGCSILETTVTSRFSIKNSNNESVWSGCVGIGLERFVYALLSTHGTDKKYWPKQLQ